MASFNLLKCLVFLLLPGLGLGGGANARDFRAADTQVEDYPTVQALVFMDRLVNERTRGRHRIRVFHSRQLGEEKETIEQTRVGAIDMNQTDLPDPVSKAIEHLNDRIQSLESDLEALRKAMETDKVQ